MLAFGLSLAFALAGVIYDVASRRRVHPAHVWRGTLLALSLPLRLAISGTAAWRAFAESLVRRASGVRRLNEGPSRTERRSDPALAGVGGVRDGVD